MMLLKRTRSRFGHNVRRPTQFVCPSSDTICPNSDKIYCYFLLINEKRDSFLPSGSWIALFWLPAETLSLKRLRVWGFPPNRSENQICHRDGWMFYYTSPHFFSVKTSVVCYCCCASLIFLDANEQDHGT